MSHHILLVQIQKIYKMCDFLAFPLSWVSCPGLTHEWIQEVCRCTPLQLLPLLFPADMYRGNPQGYFCPASATGCSCVGCQVQQETAASLYRFLLLAPAPCPSVPQRCPPLTERRCWKIEAAHHHLCCQLTQAQAESQSYF